MKQYKKLIVLLGILILVIFVGAVIIFGFTHASKQFAEPDKKLSDGNVQLCSDYADLCFTRPADWTRSSILHAGLAKVNDIEINPPSGTIFRFEAISDDTSTTCPSNYKCDIDTVNIIHLKNDLNVVSGIFDTVPTDSKLIAIHTPFIQLITSQDIHLYGLQTGRRTPFISFNPGISFNNASKVMLQVSPGEFDTQKAQQWLSSHEANTSKQILSTVRSR